MSHLTYAEAIITGILQGVTELFPISSLGHNVLVPALLGGQFKADLNVAADHSPYLAFVVALHVATAFAMIAYFWRDWIRIIRGLISSIRNRQIVEPDQRLAWMIIIGTIPVGLVGVILQKVVTSVFAQPVFTALFLMVNGGILLYSERQRTLAVDGPDAGFDSGFDAGPGSVRARGERGVPGGRGPGGRHRSDDDGTGGFWDDNSWDEDRRPTRQAPVEPPAGPRFRDDPRRGGDPRPAPGFQPNPGQPGPGQPGQPGPGFSPHPGQPGGGPARGGYGGPADDERTQVWNQQPGQQQWQGPDPRYNDPRYGQDPRYPQDPHRGAPDRRDPRQAQEPPAAGQGPAFTPSFTPAGPDPRAPQEDIRTAQYPQGVPAGAPGNGGPSFTPSGPGGAGQPPWGNGPAGGGPRGPRGYAPDPSEQTSVDVVDLPQQYDESDANIAADRRLATMSFKQALLVGAWQVLALLPGISRDGIVTVGGMRTHLRRADAVRFSFLLSAPVLLAAGVLKLPELAGPEGHGIMGPVILGSILSFIGAYLATKFLTRYFEGEKKSLKPFGYYCLGFGALCLILIPLGV